MDILSFRFLLSTYLIIDDHRCDFFQHLCGVFLYMKLLANSLLLLMQFFHQIITIIINFSKVISAVQPAPEEQSKAAPTRLYTVHSTKRNSRCKSLHSDYMMESATPVKPVANYC